MSTEEVTLKDMDALIEEIAAKRNEIDAQAEIVKALNKQLDDLEIKCIGYLKELNRENYQSPVGTIYQIKKWRVSTPKTEADKEAFFAYLKERGLFNQYATVNSNSLNAYYASEFEAAKERGEFGFTIPGLSAPSLYETVGFRKAK